MGLLSTLNPHTSKMGKREGALFLPANSESGDRPLPQKLLETELLALTYVRYY